MICPTCGCDNLPGSEECSRCGQAMAQLDLPVAHDRVERSLMEGTVGVLRPRPPLTVAPTATVKEAIQLMLDRDVGALLVVDGEGKLVGIFSERDLLTKVAGVSGQSTDLAVEQFMTANPEVATDQDTLAFALRTMDLGGYRHLPVVHEGRPVGMISVRDMLRHITRLCKEH
jgi:CBS domain-containing protein